jgi:outer membrane protein OmpA-like peptidoglycan-associated protein
MTVLRIFLSAACVLALTCPAVAQMYPGQGVAVNPAAVPANGQTVVYHGSTYVRLPPLLQPGQPYPGEPAVPVQLHMPDQHPRRVVRRARPADENVATAPAIAPSEEPAMAPVVSRAPTPAIVRETALPKPATRAVKQEAPPEPAVTNTSASTSGDAATSVPFSFGGPRQQRAAPAQQQPAIQPHAETPHPSRAVAAAQPVPTETITRAPTQPATSAPAETVAQGPMTPGEEPPNLSKRSEILFPHNGPDPVPQALTQLKQLASVLNSALDAGARRVQLDAFGGAPGDKSSDARRVSLHRALVIRQLLINDGVPASRIDIRAMGGIDDSGDADRVDVYVRAG